MSSAAGSRIPAIDGLRAIAILVVMGVHAAPDALPGGFWGVDLFFVISGYLITGQLKAEWDAAGRIDWPAFLRRRFFRIWPAFTVLLAIALIASFAPGLESYRWSVLVALFSLTNWASVVLGADFGGALRHTWSLSAEEQFYLIWPALLVLGGLLSRPRQLAMVLLFLTLATTAWRILLFTQGADGSRLYNGLDTHNEGLLLGCAIALWAPKWRRAIAERLWIVSGAVLAAALFGVVAHSLFNLTAGLLVLAACAAVLLMAVLEHLPGLGWLEHAWLAALGRRSYSLYLFHLPIFECMQHTGLQPQLSLAVAIGVSFLAAELSYRFVERPFLTRPTPRLASPGPDFQAAAAPRYEP